MQLPLKTRILQYAIERGTEFSLNDVMKDLKKEYEGERIFNKKQIEEYFQYFVGVEFFTANRYDFDADGEIVTYCRVTDYGRQRSKYLPIKQKAF